MKHNAVEVEVTMKTGIVRDLKKLKKKKSFH